MKYGREDWREAVEDLIATNAETEKQAVGSFHAITRRATVLHGKRLLMKAAHLHQGT